ncbi:unnamed protein product [Rhizophagus irregularis]|nr:unnamed protein product [Rhizophagus irregularis]CAB5206271.1 unnamed protein product [Rhizophagus irregularis]
MGMRCNFWDTSDAYGCGADEIPISEILKDSCIDLYNQHRVDPETPIENTLGALAELIEYSPRTLDIDTNGIMETKEILIHR